MKKKLAIIICAVIVSSLFTIGVVKDLQSRRFMKPVEIENLPLSFQLVETRHFYDDLTEEERGIYHKLENLLDHYTGGEVILDQPISSRSCFRVETALRHENEKYWRYAHLRPFNEKCMLVNATMEQENPDKLIYKLVLFIDSEAYRRLMKEALINNEHWQDMLDEYEEADPVELYKAAIECFASVYQLNLGLSFYSELADRLKFKLPEFLNEMPEGLNQEEIIQNLCQWALDNLTYDLILVEKQYNDIIKYVESLNDELINSDLSYYSEVDEKVEQKIQEILNGMPVGLNQEEAVQYFSQWLVDNMVYDFVFDEYLTTNNPDLIDINKQLADVNITCINSGESVCSGFVMILNSLCRRVGIDAYFVCGNVEGLSYGRHTWSAIMIGDEMYYKDPTSEIGTKKVRPLMTYAQFYQTHNNYKPHDWFEDLWIR
jgi:hypothetical protein